MQSSLSGLRIGSSIAHGVALLTTAYRLAHRYRIRRFSWDDAWAFLAFLLDAGELICLWLKVKFDREVPAGTPEYKRRQSIVLWYISLSFTLIMGSTRISLCVSIRRILAPGKLRNWCTPVAVVTGVIALILITIKLCMCSANPTSPNQEFPLFCTDPTPIAMFQTIADIALSVFLVGMPLYALWYMDLTSAKRNLMMFLFTTSTFTLVAALVHNIYALKRDRIMNHYTTHIEAAIALLVCNVHIVVTSFYSLCRRSEDNEDSDYTQPSDTRCEKTSRFPPGSSQYNPDGQSQDTVGLTFTDMASSLSDRGSSRLAASASNLQSLRYPDVYGITNSGSSTAPKSKTSKSGAPAVVVRMQ
ncbi:hypothetical protein WG66_013880 [Moniliophthora roreri]|nr:hypothetical protein WG66_013880 [Moniliophthora roreri]